MKKRIIFILLCNNNKSYEKLREIDHLLSIDKSESAYKEMNKIKTTDLNNERDSSYYFLLKTQTLYRLYKPVTSDSMINYSIKYYEKTNDKAKLAQAYYYKGVIINELGRVKDAIVCV